MQGGLRLLHELETILFGINFRLRNIVFSIFFLGRVFSGIEEELTTTRVPLGTLREMEKEWMNVGQSRKTEWLTLEQSPLGNMRVVPYYDRAAMSYTM